MHIPERHYPQKVQRNLRMVVSGVRWWFGLTYLAAGVAGVVAGPIMLSRGNYGGVYMLIGGPEMAALAWLIHPCGLQRRRRAARLVSGS
jgi:hypothetical protein